MYWTPPTIMYATDTRLLNNITELRMLSMVFGNSSSLPLQPEEALIESGTESELHTSVLAGLEDVLELPLPPPESLPLFLVFSLLLLLLLVLLLVFICCWPLHHSLALPLASLPALLFFAFFRVSPVSFGYFLPDLLTYVTLLHLLDDFVYVMRA